MSKKVLILDDDGKKLKLLRMLPQNVGYETIEAEMGDDYVPKPIDAKSFMNVV